LASVTSTLSQALLIDAEVYDAADVQVSQSYLDAEPFVGGVQRQFTVPWAVPTTLPPGPIR